MMVCLLQIVVIDLVDSSPDCMAGIVKSLTVYCKWINKIFALNLKLLIAKI